MELSLKIGSAFISKSLKLFRSQFQIISNHRKIMSKLFLNRFKFWEIKNTRNSPLWNCHSKLASRSFSCLPNYSENISNYFQSFRNQIEFFPIISNLSKLKTQKTLLYEFFAQNRLRVHFKVFQMFESFSIYFQTFWNHIESIFIYFNFRKNQKHKKLSLWYCH